MRIYVTGIEKGIAKTGNEYLKVQCITENKDRVMYYIWDRVNPFMVSYETGEKIYEVTVTGDPNFPKIVDYKVAGGDISEFHDFIYESEEYSGNLLNDLIGTIGDEFIKSLINEVMSQEMFAGEKTVREEFIVIPAAKAYHHNYKYGLMQHTHEVMGFIANVSKAVMFAGEINRDIALSGGLLHDVGKVYEYEFNGITCEYGESLGKNQIYTGSHLYKGAEMVALGYKSLTTKNPEYKTEKNDIKVEHIKHIIMSHHLQPEWGAIPKAPKTLEAYLVFLADYFSAAYGKYKVLDKKGITKQSLLREASKYDNFIMYNELQKQFE